MVLLLLLFNNSSVNWLLFLSNSSIKYVNLSFSASSLPSILAKSCLRRSLLNSLKLRTPCKLNLNFFTFTFLHLHIFYTLFISSMSLTVPLADSGNISFNFSRLDSNVSLSVIPCLRKSSMLSIYLIA